MEDRFMVTVYSQNGYSEIVEIGQQLRDLKDPTIDSGITERGLSVSGPRSSYEAFASVVDRFPSATFKEGSSIYRH